MGAGPLTVPAAVTGAARRRFAVVGSPIGHSLSPVMHRAAYAALGRTDVEYSAIEVREGELRALLAPDGAATDLAGLSVTMPLKREARALAVEADDISERLGIANTLIRRSDGTWRAENHDVHGIAAALRDHGLRDPSTGAVIGSGATAVSAVAALVELGVRDLRLTARSPEKLAPAVALAEAHGISTAVVPWLEAGVLDADVAVSALAGPGAAVLADHLARSASSGPLPSVLLDVLYEPWPAPVAAVLAQRGVEIASGLEMLVHQAGRQVESMLTVDAAPLDAMRTAAQQELTRRR